MSILSSLIGGAKNILTGGTGKKVLTAGAQALLESRRDNLSGGYTGDPPSTPGMPTVTMAGIPAWALPGPGVVGKLGGKIVAAAGTAYTAYQAAQAVGGMMGAKGNLGAVPPVTRDVRTSRCPRGYAIAIDGFCYPKSMLPRQLRKWQPEPRPVVSRSDQKAIRRSAAAKKRLVKITKDSGAFASLTRPHHHETKRKK